jgi:hypothetical protein
MILFNSTPDVSYAQDYELSNTESQLILDL